MAKKRSKSKSKYKFSYDAPVSLTFVLVAVVLFLLDLLLMKGKLNAEYLLSPTAGGGNLPFDFKNILSYLRLLLYVFGGTEPFVLLSNLIFIILLGPEMETRYGSVVIGIMIFVTVAVSGVLNACFCNFSNSGASPVVFMLIILDILMHLTKKTISASAVIVICLFTASQFFTGNKNGLVGVLITLAGGLCGSLFAFMASPKARAAKKQQKVDERIAEIDAQSPRFKNKAGKNSGRRDVDDDATVVGTLEF